MKGLRRTSNAEWTFSGRTMFSEEAEGEKITRRVVGMGREGTAVEDEVPPVIGTKAELKVQLEEGEAEEIRVQLAGGRGGGIQGSNGGGRGGGRHKA